MLFAVGWQALYLQGEEKLLKIEIRADWVEMLYIRCSLLSLFSRYRTTRDLRNGAVSWKDLVPSDD